MTPFTIILTLQAMHLALRLRRIEDHGDHRRQLLECIALLVEKLVAVIDTAHARYDMAEASFGVIGCHPFQPIHGSSSFRAYATGRFFSHSSAASAVINTLLPTLTARKRPDFSFR